MINFYCVTGSVLGRRTNHTAECVLNDQSNYDILSTHESATHTHHVLLDTVTCAHLYYVTPNDTSLIRRHINK